MFKWINETQASRTARDAAHLMCGIASGLSHAHDRGVIHRDLTPGNVIVDQNDQPHILDFGLAKLVSSDQTVSVHGQVIGTPAYVSPEQVSGAGHEVDGRTDIYASGVILFHLLTGQRPFDGEIKLLLHRIRFQDPPNPRTVNPDVPERLSEICLRSLQKEPAGRYPTAKAFLEDLQGFLLQESDSKAVTASKFSLTTFWICAALLAFAAFLLPAVINRRTGVAPVPSEERSHQVSSIADLGDASVAATTLDASTTLDSDPAPDSVTNILRGHNATVSGIAFSADGSRLLTCGHDGAVVAWDWKTRKQVWRNEDHQGAIWSIAVAPDSTRVATASWDLTACILDIETGKVVQTFSGHEGRICCVKYLADGKTIVTAATDGTIRFWNATTGKQQRLFKVPNAEFVSFVFADDDQSIVAVDWKGSLTKWDLESGEIIFRNSSAHEGPAWTVCLVEHLNAIASGGQDGFMRLWDIATGDLVKEKRVADEHVTCICVHPNGRQLMHSSHESTVCTWQENFNAIESRFCGHEHWVYEFAVHPDNQHVVSVGVDKTARIWDIRSSQQ